MPTSAIVPAILPVHILAGAFALLVGYFALFAAKGGSLHRRSGRFFVAAMVTMSLSGALVAALNSGRVSVSVVAGLLTFYLVTTSLLTVRRFAPGVHWTDRAALVGAVVAGLTGFLAGFEILASGKHAPEMVPSFIFGVVGLLAARGDLRLVRNGGIQGSEKLTRHLWRMCFAMWIAAASFFWGPPDRVPEVIRIPALLPIPVLTPLVVMCYWLWRLRARRNVLSLQPKGQLS